MTAPVAQAPELPISEAEWARLRASATAAPPPTVEGQSVLMPYQQELLEAIDRHEVVVMEKSRRIGATWGVGA